MRPRASSFSARVNNQAVAQYMAFESLPNVPVSACVCLTHIPVPMVLLHSLKMFCGLHHCQKHILQRICSQLLQCYVISTYYNIRRVHTWPEGKHSTSNILQRFILSGDVFPIIFQNIGCNELGEHFEVLPEFTVKQSCSRSLWRPRLIQCPSLFEMKRVWRFLTNAEESVSLTLGNTLHWMPFLIFSSSCPIRLWRANIWQDVQSSNWLVWSRRWWGSCSSLRGYCRCKR